ncbi:hypothetical protein PQE71_gp032 [Bacillus phage Izhevsk]|uniref:Uncharacterized protein n=1 Tax=Bacillus phage Izhevsk TaxID=2724322 RepID=A0A6H0X5X2_9CAUD|nr:hypothetical protein PQE71_gp032 [Bacillus phage Izhevsk]QIW89714.1 hypothetical protein Izhevsk_32 [Bacillus phage Izhevsk]
MDLYKSDLIRKLERFRSKACCQHTLYQAHNLWTQVKDHLTKQQQLDIRDAWHHARMDSNRGNKVLHDTVNAVIKEIKE